MTWATGPWLGFDTETTGVDPLSARLVTACVAYRSTDDTQGWTRQWLTDAGHELIPDAAIAVHGITTEKAHAEGQPVIDAAEDIREHLQKAWAQGIPVVGMNVCYDLTLLNTELLRAGHRDLSIDGPVLDPLVLDRAADRYRRGSRKLADLCAHYQVPHTAAAPGEDASTAAGAHDAAADALAALRVLWRIGQRYPTLATLSLEEIHAKQVAAHIEWATHLQSYLRESGKEPDAVIDTAWPIRRATAEAGSHEADL